MSELSTEYLEKCLETLEKSYEVIKATDKDTTEYEVCRNSLIKAFEITLEQSGKLLKKKITPYFATKKELDRLQFKEIFRYAFERSLISEEVVKRWFKYRDNRNNTVHDYGQNFAEETLAIIKLFIDDVKQLVRIIERSVSKLNLKPEYAEELRKIFRAYCPKAEIWAYGSRLDGDSHDGSDLDLVVANFNDSQKNISKLKQIIIDSDIPFLVDIFELNKLPLTFQNEIRKKYIVFYKEEEVV